MLGLALATNAVLFGLLTRLFLAEPPLVRQPHDIFRIEQVWTVPGRGRIVNATLSYPQYSAIAALHDANVAGSRVMSMSIGEGTTSRRVAAAFVTESYFRFLGVRPEIGRTFSTVEAEPPFGTAVVVLGHEVWVRRFGASVDVLGRRLRVGRTNYTIIGVLPATFRGLGRRPVDVWLPLAVAGALSYGPGWDFDGGAFWIDTFVRLPKGNGHASAAARIDASLARPSPGSPHVVLTRLNAANGPQRGLQDRVSLWLGGLALVVLLIACANIGSALLTRHLERRAETAVRLALGGSRWLLGANVLGEAVGLSACGGVLGWALALGISRVIAGPLQTAGIEQAAGIDATLLLWMLLLVLGVAMLTSALPLMALRARGLQPVLRTAFTTASYGRERARLVLLAGQVALTTALAVCAGLFVQSFAAVRRIDPGFDPERVLVTDLNPLGETTPREVESEYAKVQVRLQGDPMVVGTAIATTAPFFSGALVRVVVAGVDSLPGNPNNAVWVNGVTPGFFDVMQMRLLRGRILRSSDANGAPVAVVTRHFATSAWGSANPLHQCFHILSRTAPCVEVVGVLADPERDKLGEMPESQFFVPLAQVPRATSTRLFFVRFRGDRAAAAAHLVGVIRKTLANSPSPRVLALGDLVGGQRRPWAWGATLLTFFCSLAVLMAGLGLHSVLSFELKARERDLAIRAALGANGTGLARAALRRSAFAVVGGLTCGLIVGWVLGHRLQPVLFRTEPVTVALDATIVLVTVAMFATAVLGPILRLTRSDVAAVLRGA